MSTNQTLPGRRTGIFKDGARHPQTGEYWRDIYVDGKWTGGAYQTYQQAKAKLERLLNNDEPRGGK